MRHVLFAALMLSACGPAAPPQPLPETADVTERTWFICDGVDAPAVLLFERDGQTARVAEYDKPNGAIVSRDVFELGQEEGAAGSNYTPLLKNGQESGAIRQTNPGMLETPGAAYTPRIIEVRLGERVVSCRWLPRTRLFGFTGRRSFVVHEDVDGDLIYTTFDFTSAAASQPISLSENGVSTTFSAEARGGEETVSPDGATFRFTGADGYSYVVTARRDGQGVLEVRRGDTLVQSEPLEASQTGEAGGE